MKKIIALILAVVSLFSMLSVFAFAEAANETVTVTVNETDFIFDADTTEEFRSRAIAHYFNEDNGTAYGLTCTLFGHKTESSVILVRVHKVNAEDPRCRLETRRVEFCERCDYTNSVLVEFTNISCC